MQVTDIRIFEIERSRGRPFYARGWAALSNGRSYHFDVNFAPGCTNERIFVWSSNGDTYMDPTNATSQAIRDRLGLTDIDQRERNALAAFEHDRFLACQALLRPPPTPTSPTQGPFPPRHPAM